MGKAMKYVAYSLFIPIWWLQRILPRNRNIWVFGSWYGQRYSDNSKYLFEYIRNTHPEIKCVWLTRNRTVKNVVRDTGAACYLTRSLEGWYYSLRAKYAVVSSGKRDLNYLAISGATTVQLWHGNPMKMIGLDDRFSPAHSFIQSRIVPLFFPFIYEFNFDHIVSNADIFTGKMASAFNVPLANVFETGCPRNDVFYHPQEADFTSEVKTRFPGSKIIFYLPTFRSPGQRNSLFVLEDYNANQVEKYLEVHNMVLVNKGHYVDNTIGEASGSVSSRIIHLSDKDTSDINFLLKDADALITDYSGAYFDFLLLERPILFAAFDLEDYLSKSREMYFEYNEAVAGPIVENWDELLTALSQIWEDESVAELLRKKNKLFNKYHDAENSKRVFQAISQQ